MSFGHLSKHSTDVDFLIPYTHPNPLKRVICAISVGSKNWGLNIKEK
jgi:hypothetical protein